MEATNAIERPEKKTFSEDNESDSESEDLVETIPLPSETVQGLQEESPQHLAVEISRDSVWVRCRAARVPAVLKRGLGLLTEGCA